MINVRNDGFASTCLAVLQCNLITGLLPDTQNCGLRMRRECRERFPRRHGDPDMHQGMCVTHVPWCMPILLTSSFLWSQWREKSSRHSRRMRNPQFYVSGKRPMLRQLMYTRDKYEMNAFINTLWIIFYWNLTISSANLPPIKVEWSVNKRRQ